MQNEQNKYLNAKDVANFLNVKSVTIRGLVKAGKLQRYKPLSQITIIKKSDLINFFESTNNDK